MRFIIKEQPYEKLLSAGQFRYEMDGRPTGAVEHWRLTEVDDDYRVLRVDLDARAAESGHSYLYHAVLNENGRFERLKYRFWGDEMEITGDIVLNETNITASREVNGQSFDETLDLPVLYGFWFPSTIGVGMLAAILDCAERTAVGLSAVSNQQSAFSLFTTKLDLALTGDQLTVRWDNQKRELWLDEHMWPVKMVRGGLSDDSRLTAVATRHINYQRITNPGSKLG